MHVRVKFMNFVYNLYIKIPIYVNMFSLVNMKYCCATNKYIQDLPNQLPCNIAPHKRTQQQRWKYVVLLKILYM